MSAPRIPFRQSRNDLYADLKCECPNPRYIGTDLEPIMKHYIQLVGYSDANFFDNVNAEPRVNSCRCGRPYRVQWFRDGVEAEFIGPYIGCPVA